MIIRQEKRDRNVAETQHPCGLSDADTRVQGCFKLKQHLSFMKSCQGHRMF